MELKSADLGRALARGLLPVYLVSGDETLLVQEACDTIIAAARAAGFGERLIMHADTTAFDWNEVVQETASLSLFADRRVIDVRVGGGKLGREGADVLTAFARNPGPDTLLLVRCARLEKQQLATAWYKALVAAAAVVRIWPVEFRELPRWLGERLAAAELRLTDQALGALAERVEGNLLAAVQEIEKLKLHELPQPITLEALLGVLEDSAHYGTFELIDAVLQGDAARVVRMLAGLRQEGVAVFALLGAFAGQLRGMAGRVPMPPQRARLVGEFERRLGRRTTPGALLATCALIDAQGKGELPGDPWVSLEELLLGLCTLRAPGASTALRELHPIARQP